MKPITVSKTVFGSQKIVASRNYISNGVVLLTLNPTVYCIKYPEIQALILRSAFEINGCKELVTHENYETADIAWKNDFERIINMAGEYKAIKTNRAIILNAAEYAHIFTYDKNSEKKEIVIHAKYAELLPSVGDIFVSADEKLIIANYNAKNVLIVCKMHIKIESGE